MQFKTLKEKVVNFFTTMGKTTPKKPAAKRVRKNAGQGAGVQSNSVKEFPTFEGAKVTAVLKENDVNGFHSCKMSDGTTKHVPVSLFE